MLVRDIANPSTRDQYFPVWRCFDWFHGHSWAHGLFDTLDGKDQESSSEDTMHAYALKMWGSVSGDKNMEARCVPPFQSPPILNTQLTPPSGET